MGRLIIDGNSVFELDEECLKNRKVSPECDLDKYLNTSNEFKKDKNKTDRKQNVNCSI